MSEFTEQEIRDVETELFEKRIVSRIPCRTVAKAVLRSRKTYGDTSDETVCVSREDVDAAVRNFDSDGANGEDFDSIARLEQAIGSEMHTRSNYPARHVTPDPWRKVPHCTCAGYSLGPGAHESDCGWVQGEVRL